MINPSSQSEIYHTDFIGKPPNALVGYGITFVFVFMIMIVVFAWKIDYSDSISARITINSLNPTITVISNDFGVVESVLVSNDDFVELGQEILLIKSNAELSSVKKLKYFLNSNLNLVNTQLPLKLESLGPLRLDYENLIGTLLKYRILLENSLESLKISLINDENESLSNRISNLYEQKSFILEKSTISQTEYNRVRKLIDNNLLASKDLDSAKKYDIDRQLELSQIIVNINIVEAKRSSNVIKLNTILVKNEIDLNVFEKKIQSQKSILQDKIITWEKKHVLVATISGNVSIPENIYNYQNIINQQELFSLVPLSNNYIGTIKVSERGTGKIKVGQTVFIKLDSYPFVEFGLISGQVLSKSSSIHDDAVFVKIKINNAQDNNLVTSYKKHIKYIPNMQGSVEIVINKRSLLSRLFDSIYKILNK